MICYNCICLTPSNLTYDGSIFIFFVFFVLVFFDMIVLIFFVSRIHLRKMLKNHIQVLEPNQIRVRDTRTDFIQASRQPKIFEDKENVPSCAKQDKKDA